MSLSWYQTACSGLRRARTAPRSGFGGFGFKCRKLGRSGSLNVIRSVGGKVVVTKSGREVIGYTEWPCVACCVEAMD